MKFLGLVAVAATFANAAPSNGTVDAQNNSTAIIPTNSTKMPVPQVGDDYVTLAWSNGAPIDIYNIEIKNDTYVVMIDPYDVEQSFIEDLKAKNHYILCYLNSGAREDWRLDVNGTRVGADIYTPDMLATDMEEWAGETWFDITKLELLKAPHLARMEWMKSVGCDGLDHDNVDCNVASCVPGVNDEDLHKAQIEYAAWLGQSSHLMGMDASLKNAQSIMPEVAQYFDMAINEQCEEWRQWGDCDPFTPYFIEQGKPVFAVEYTHDPILANCDAANAANFTRHYYATFPNGTADEQTYLNCQDQM
eukprot:CFRG6921T1